jgi:outer membrane immunogenic protein
MRQPLLASIGCLAFAVAGSAGAADLPVKAVLPVTPTFTWTGCYIGGNAGWAGARNSADLSPSGLYRAAPGANAPPNLAGTGDFAADIAALSNSYSTTGSAWEGGIQVGCNRQWSAVVLGVEADWQWTDTKTSADATYAAFPNAGNPLFTNPAHTEHVDVSQKWVATARARFGFTPWDRVLVYGTAGIAWADFSSNTAVAFATAPAFFLVPPYSGAIHLGSASSTRVGAVAGGGIEWAIANNWSVKAEYLYMWFDGFSYASPLVASFAPAAPGYAWNTTITPHAQVARIGVNYKFDWSEPLVARY